MKLYGARRKDKLECKYGCCGYKALPWRAQRRRVRKALRHRARQQARISTREDS